MATSEDTLILRREWEIRFLGFPIRECLAEALMRGLITPVYRLNLPAEYENPTTWTTDLMSLRKPFVVGTITVDGANPKRIEVAFKRTGCFCTKNEPTWSKVCSYCKGYPGEVK